MGHEMTNDHGHDAGEKGYDIKLPAEDVDRDDDDEEWSPDNDLSKKPASLWATSLRMKADPPPT